MGKASLYVPITRLTGISARPQPSYKTALTGGATYSLYSLFFLLFSCLYPYKPINSYRSSKGTATRHNLLSPVDICNDKVPVNANTAFSKHILIYIRCRSVRPGEGESLPLRRGHKGAVPGAGAGHPAFRKAGTGRQHRHRAHFPPHSRASGGHLIIKLLQLPFSKHLESVLWTRNYLFQIRSFRKSQVGIWI
jgi:hypothetical protein